MRLRKTKITDALERLLSTSDNKIKTTLTVQNGQLELNVSSTSPWTSHRLDEVMQFESAIKAVAIKLTGNNIHPLMTMEGLLLCSAVVTLCKDEFYKDRDVLVEEMSEADFQEPGLPTMDELSDGLVLFVSKKCRNFIKTSTAVSFRVHRVADYAKCTDTILNVIRDFPELVAKCKVNYSIAS